MPNQPDYPNKRFKFWIRYVITLVVLLLIGTGLQSQGVPVFKVLSELVVLTLVAFGLVYAVKMAWTGKVK